MKVEDLVDRFFERKSGRCGWLAKERYRDKVEMLPDDTVKYYLHRTDIATLDPDGRILTLKNGGWCTRTTADRINKILSRFVRAVRVWRIQDWRLEGMYLRIGFTNSTQESSYPSGLR